MSEERKTPPDEVEAPDAPVGGTDSAASAAGVPSSSSSSSSSTHVDATTGQVNSLRSVLDAALDAIADASANAGLEPALPKRCAFQTCKKKIPITRTACACGKVFCSTHSFFTAHSCDVDYRKREENEIKRQQAIRKSYHGAGAKPPDGSCAF
jgi:hypothetical protein